MTTDFEEAAELLDRIVENLLKKCRIDQPPIEPKKIADRLGILYNETDLDGRRGQSFRRRGRQHVEIHHEDRPERKNFALAHEIMELELKKALDDPKEAHRWANLGASFLLMPTPWFREQCFQGGFDIALLKKAFSTASWEAVALRTLNFSESIISVVDATPVASLPVPGRKPTGKTSSDSAAGGSPSSRIPGGRLTAKVTRRKSSCPFYMPKKLSDEETQVVEEILRTRRPLKRHFPSCEVAGYPVFEEEHRRVILRTTLDESAEPTWRSSQE
jgi:hypothetical protein